MHAPQWSRGRILGPVRNQKKPELVRNQNADRQHGGAKPQQNRDHFVRNYVPTDDNYLPTETASRSKLMSQFFS